MNKKEIINNIAKIVYQSAHGGTTTTNFKDCFDQYTKGRIGWIKEANAYVAALVIYDDYIKKGR